LIQIFAPHWADSIQLFTNINSINVEKIKDEEKMEITIILFFVRNFGKTK